MLTCVIIDDDSLSIANLKKHIATRNELCLVDTFKDPLEGIEYLKQNDIDIVFLDIFMPKKTGLEVAKEVRNDFFIIFTTSSSKHALDAYQLDAIAYLLKPISIERFNAAVSRAALFINGSTINTANTLPEIDNAITVISDKKSYKLQIKEIIYIESLLEYVAYHTDKNKIMCLGSLKKIVDKFPKNQFIRIHKSYLVNKEHIISYTKTIITLSNNQKLDIGRIYKDAFLEAMKT